MNIQPTSMDELGQYIIAEVSKTNKVVGLAWNLTWGKSMSNTHCAPQGYRTNWEGDVTDEDGKPIPSGYPGWQGRIWIRFDTRLEPFASHLLEKTFICTGTGGSGAYGGIWSAILKLHYESRSPAEDCPNCFSWSVQIWDNDWPTAASSLQEQHKKNYKQALEDYQKKVVWARLTDARIQPFSFPELTHNFAWTDPVQLKKDKEFAALFETLK